MQSRPEVDSVSPFSSGPCYQYPQMASCKPNRTSVGGLEALHIRGSSMNETTGHARHRGVFSAAN